jgi:hypothetical protein
MKLDRLTPTDFDLHVEAEELAALVAAARCAMEPGCSELTARTQELVRRLVAQYDEQATTMRTPFSGARTASIRLDPPTEDVLGHVMYDPF